MSEVVASFGLDGGDRGGVDDGADNGLTGDRIC